MLLSALAVIAGLLLLIWSANLFIEGASSTAHYFGLPPLLIGMVIVGFGTSAPEMVVSAIASLQGNPGLALGNAYGSNISNIALILGVTALIKPIAVQSKVLRKELPVLALVTLLAAWQVFDDRLSRLDGTVLLVVFFSLMGWAVRQGMTGRRDALGEEMDRELSGRQLSLSAALLRLVAGMVLLVVSSRLLVWGAVDIARQFGVSDLLIGLTIVAIGTSLPELASSVVAARRGEHDIALGNVIGSNLFNTLAVVGIAATIEPMAVSPEVLSRDILVMGALTLLLFVFGFGFRGPGRINRFEGGALLCCYVGYSAYLVRTALLGG